MKKGLLVLGLLIVCHLHAQVSPLDYGLRESNRGMGCYFALLNAHRAAIAMDMEVDYTGVDTLYMELPPDFKSIPVGPHTDFKGLVIYVTNNAHHGALFAMANEEQGVELDKAQVESLDFKDIPALSEGTQLLILNDKTPWTERRGYGYQAYRRDILVVQNGIGQNRPIASWNSEATQLAASRVVVDTAEKAFRNLTIHRTRQSTYKTYCLSLSRVYNFVIENIHITTPRSRMIADGAISINNSAHITLRNITVEGTYSGYGRTRNYGYAFSLNNIYDLQCHDITAWGNWGVFGANNMNRSYLENCDIDRYDVHCYGRDIHMVKCRLAKRQTPISSIYGTVRFDSCRFVDFIPVRIRSSYNAYTPFDIEIHDCVFELTPRYHSIVRVDLLDTADNPRPELKEKSLPNLTVDGLDVIVPLSVGRLNIYDPRDNLRDLKREWGYISTVSLKGIRTQRRDGRKVDIPIRFSSHPFRTKSTLNYTIE